MARTQAKTGTRKRKTTIEEVIPENELDGEEQQTDFDVALESVEDAETLRGVLEQFGQSGATFKIYRQTPTGDSFCYVTDAIDEEFIQKNYGGGDFKVRVFINGKFRIPMKLKIEPRMETGNGNGSHSTDGHSAFLEKLLLTILAREPQTPAAGPSITDLTTALASLDSLRGKQESGIDMFLKGATFGRENGGGSGDWKSDAISAIREGIPALAPALGTMLGKKPLSPTPPIPQPGTKLDEIPPDQQLAGLKAGIDYLKKKCISGLDPDFIVEWVENNADEYQGLISEVLNRPFEGFVEIDAQIGTEPFKSWFTKLFNGLRSAFVPQDSVGVDSAGEHGRSDDAGNNGNVITVTVPKGK